VIDERMLDSLTEGTREDLFCRVEIAGLQRLYAWGHLGFERGRRSFLRSTPSCRGEKQQQKSLAMQAPPKRISRSHDSPQHLVGTRNSQTV